MTNKSTRNTCFLIIWALPIRKKLSEAKSEHGIPAKLIGIRKMALTDTKSSVKVSKDLSEDFETEPNLRQDYTLSRDLGNILRDIIMRNGAVNTRKSNNMKSHTYAARLCCGCRYHWVNNTRSYLYNVFEIGEGIRKSGSSGEGGQNGVNGLNDWRHHGIRPKRKRK